MGETLRFKYQTSRSRTKRGNTEVQKLSWFPLSKSVPVLWKGANLEKAMQADDSDGNDSSPPSSPTAESGSQRCVACPVLISRDWPRRLWPTCVSGGLACHGRSNHLVGGNIMSLLTGGEHAKSCSWGWSQSLPHRVQFQHTIDTRACPQTTADIDGLRYSPDDPHYGLGPVYTSLYVRVAWGWWLGHFPRSPGTGEGGDWWSWPMGVKAKGMLRVCQGESSNFRIP